MHSGAITDAAFVFKFVGEKQVERGRFVSSTHTVSFLVLNTGMATVVIRTGPCPSSS